MASITQQTVQTKIPARMDRLPWSRWHWLVVVSLGTVWILDGLEVTIKGAVGPAIKETLGFSTFGVAAGASIYLLGAILGALFWGYLTDRHGRKKLFIATIVVYIVGVSMTSITGLLWTEGWAYAWFGIARFITGFAIGGEYAAINSAIDEMMPARVRGWLALAINGSYWIGTLFGAVLGTVYLNIFSLELGWRIAFATGLLLGVGILLLRFFVPESPRWLMTHGRTREAEDVIRDIEEDVKESVDEELREPSDEEAIELRQRRSVGFVELAQNLFRVYPRRSLVGFALLGTQAFLYNAIFFTFGLMLTTYFTVDTSDVGLFLIPFAVGNFLGPLILGRFFDTRGRRTMIPLTFITAAILTVATGLLFAIGVIASAWLMTLCWVIIFFFASAGASAGYLTVSETFPLELRAMAIAFFYAFGTLVGGVPGPAIFGALITPDNPWTIFYGYLFGAGLMALGGVVHRIWGIEAAQRGLEDVTAPLSAEEAEQGGGAALEGPSGIDPSDADVVRAFQEEHDLARDGVIGPETMGALRALSDGDGLGELSVVDPRSQESVIHFQRSFGLVPDGIVGPQTQGAIRTAERREIVDLADADSVRRFQREHGLTEDGAIGPETGAALAAVRARRSREEASETYLEVDPLDAESVRRFQRACGLEEDGVFGDRSRGALRVERSRRERNAGIDPADRGSIEAFQRAAGLEADGVIGPQTQERIAAQRVEREHKQESAADNGSERPGRLFGVDPLDAHSVRLFQREHGLTDDGCIGPETRRVLRRHHYMVLELDPTDPATIEAFQRRYGLAVDGVIGPETQGALRALRDEREPIGIEEEGKDEREEADEDWDERADDRRLLTFDIADPEAVRHFQREHGLEEDGVIGPRTQAALRAVLRERQLELSGREMPRPERRARSLTTGHSPAGTFTFSVTGEDREFDHELAQILRALHADEPLSRRELRQRVNAGRWGPGRFRYVLDTAEEEGALRRVGDDRYARAG